MTISDPLKSLIGGLILFCLLTQSANLFASEPTVSVAISGESVTIDVELLIAASPQQVWSVWTDYENMPKFIPSLKESRIVVRQGNLYQLYQRGISQHGPITFPFEAHHQDEQILPYQAILTHQLQGSLKSLAASTRFIADGEGTRVTYHADSISGFWMPPIVTKLFIQHETSAHFRLMRDEVLKRNPITQFPEPAKLSLKQLQTGSQLSELSSTE
jgi:uncharacterized protein YndB with AHSA1/START domain